MSNEPITHEELDAESHFSYDELSSSAFKQQVFIAVLTALTNKMPTRTYDDYEYVAHAANELTQVALEHYSKSPHGRAGQMKDWASGSEMI